jgi:hypothetical protein
MAKPTEEAPMLRAKHCKHAALSLTLAMAGCGDDTALPEEGNATEDGGMTSGAVTLTTAETGSTTSGSETESLGTDSGGGAMAFLVTIENLSSRTALPTPLSPGAWATHSESESMFVVGDAATAGLRALAEDGDPGALARELRETGDFGWSDVFDTPRGAGAASPALPNDAYEFMIMATSDAPRLSFAAMISQSNDVFLATPPEGIALFDEEGRPIGATDITSHLVLWDAGSEANEAPGMGRNQAPRQDAPDTGPAENGVHPFTHETRGLPVGRALAEVSIEEVDGEFTIVVHNVSAEAGAMVTPLSPIFYAVHDETFVMFESETPAREALEVLAEDGDPSAMVDAHASASGVLVAGMQAMPVGVSEARPAEPGEAFEIVVSPDARHRWLSFATMVAQTNDVFLALHPQGVALVDELGTPRELATIEIEIRQQLTTWDAGTERNQVSGVGLDQAPRQAGANVGSAEDGVVHRYADSTNDLAGTHLGGSASVQIVGNGDGTFEVSVRNTSDQTAYPGMFSPLMWLLHNESIEIFDAGEPATPGLEALAEDGDPRALLAELQGANGVMMAGIVGTPDGTKEMRPLEPGEAYVFTVEPQVGERFFNFASMIVPSNDTFVAFGNGGLALLEEDGAPRADGQIAFDIAMYLQAWDAGTEANQASAAGPDQAPYQSAPNVGASQGDGTVRRFDDPVWVYPAPEESFRVTIHPRP